jgi:hypothetical protein
MNNPQILCTAALNVQRKGVNVLVSAFEKLSRTIKHLEVFPVFPGRSSPGHVRHGLIIDKNRVYLSRFRRRVIDVNRHDGGEHFGEKADGESLNISQVWRIF